MPSEARTRSTGGYGRGRSPDGRLGGDDQSSNRCPAVVPGGVEVEGAFSELSERRVLLYDLPPRWRQPLDILAGWEIDQHSASPAMPKIGDESMAFIDYTPSDHVVGMVAAARTGTVICQLGSWDTTKPADHVDEVFAFTRMCIQRAKQGRLGRTADAVVESG
ncbi:hypothetical protein [Streptomyces olivaceoviridis]|uniref:hypothetical protein n=1 Tax=Streptomyces olivaceoviridis TaxID=1921 RepID=UPI00370352F6